MDKAGEVQCSASIADAATASRSSEEAPARASAAIPPT